MASHIADMFNEIAGSYDRLNHLFSVNIDKIWRRKALKGHITPQTGRVLDVACGTGDFAIEIVRQGARMVDGVDISEGMLAEGRKKIRERGQESRISLRVDDCAALSAADNTYDVATIAFGVRNFERRAESLVELFRVLKPGGELIILEFSTPRHFPVKQLYKFYFSWVMPKIGGLISGKRSAYEYLPRSVYAFPQGEAFLAELAQAGFTDLSDCRFTFGIASVYYGKKPCG